MLSDEEKKAIEELKKVRWNSLAVVVKNEDGKMDISYFTEKHKKTLLNLIKKQSKEIEELKEKTKKCEYYEMVADELYKNSVSKDKIKATIEELQEDIKYSANPLSIDNSKFGIKVLQSLLEKE